MPMLDAVERPSSTPGSRPSSRVPGNRANGVRAVIAGSLPFEDWQRFHASTSRMTSTGKDPAIATPLSARWLPGTRGVRFGSSCAERFLEGWVSGPVSCRTGSAFQSPRNPHGRQSWQNSRMSSQIVGRNSPFAYCAVSPRVRRVGDVARVTANIFAPIACGRRNTQLGYCALRAYASPQHRLHFLRCVEVFGDAAQAERLEQFAHRRAGSDHGERHGHQVAGG
jgi:hypothetical protein